MSAPLASEGRKGGFGRASEKGKEPSALLPRARSRVLIPFPFPFERLPRRLGKVYRLCLRFALSAFLQSTALSVSCNQGRALGNDALTQ